MQYAAAVVCMFTYMCTYDYQQRIDHTSLWYQLCNPYSLLCSDLSNVNDDNSSLDCIHDHRSMTDDT